jgi:hypothetical protein
MSREDAQERLVDALLEGAYGDAKERERIRVENVMRQIHGPPSISMQNPPPDPRRRTLRRMATWALAASVLIGLFAINQNLSSSRKAWAVIERSMVAAADEVVRHYQLRVTRGAKSPQDEETSREISSDLYVQGRDRFLWVRPGFLAPGLLRVGRNRETAWLAPPAGPIRVGPAIGLLDGLSTHDESYPVAPQLSEILGWLKLGYEVHWLGDEAWKQDGANTRPNAPQPITCRHIRGTLRSNRSSRLPQTIDLWSDMEKGIVLRIEARWIEPQSSFGVSRIDLTWMGNPTDLPADWFDYASYAGDRPVLGWDSPDETDRTLP